MLTAGETAGLAEWITDDICLVFFLSEHDETMTKWRWFSVKQVGNRPSARTGMSVSTAPNNKNFVFGGVQDVKDEEEELESQFYNDLYFVALENEKAHWTKGEIYIFRLEER